MKYYYEVVLVKGEFSWQCSCDTLYDVKIEIDYAIEHDMQVYYVKLKEKNNGHS